MNIDDVIKGMPDLGKKEGDFSALVSQMSQMLKQQNQMNSKFSNLLNVLTAKANGSFDVKPLIDAINSINIPEQKEIDLTPVIQSLSALTNQVSALEPADKVELSNPEALKDNANTQALKQVVSKLDKLTNEIKEKKSEVGGFEKLADAIKNFRTAVALPIPAFKDSSGGSSQPLVEELNTAIAIDAPAAVVRSSDPQDDIVLGKRTGVTHWNKFGFRDDLQAASGEQTVWAASGNYTVPTGADTFNIAYDGTAGGSTDGAGTNGARVLTFYYIDSSGLPAISTHTLETDGTDTTSFSGLGINRIAVSSTGSDTYNASDITVTHTSSGNTMAIIPAQGSVTQQAIFHVGSNHTAVAKFLKFNVNKLSGSNPKVTVKAYVYNRGVATRFEVFRHIIDTQSENTVTLNEPVGFRLNATDVLYFVADTDQNNTVITLRFSLNEYQNS